jgi:hypothetical protein
VDQSGQLIGSMSPIAAAGSCGTGGTGFLGKSQVVHLSSGVSNYWRDARVDPLARRFARPPGSATTLLPGGCTIRSTSAANRSKASAQIVVAVIDAAHAADDMDQTAFGNVGADTRASSTPLPCVAGRAAATV